MADYSILVDSRTFGKGAQKEQLFSLFRAYSLEPTFLSMEDATEIISEFDGLIIGTSKVTRDILAQARNLRVIIKYGVGIDNIDAAAAREYGIKILNLPGINAQSVAELALGMMFAVARNIVKGDRELRNGNHEEFIGTSVIGKVLGVIGTGYIGCALTKMVSGLDMTVLGYDIIHSPDFTASGGEYATLDHVLKSADFISLHLPLTQQTFHFMDRKKLGCMKKSAFLINTSRGKVVDEKTLMEFLAAGQIAGAALDVFENEPPALKDLLKMKNVIITPHIGAHTDETLRRMDETCISTLSSALHDKKKETTQ
ncbi:MAG: phosphoglycerate dehydrogenase [Desulfobacterales bacterium]|nr:phosphoglycerate dehydrogenase [Desulfobacterales bacterium]